MTSETETTAAANMNTHGTGSARRVHAWRYLGKAAQAYICAECQLRVTKTALKEATDA